MARSCGKSLEAAAASHEGHSLEAFRDQLRDLCGHDFEGARHDRPRRAKDQAEQELALAREHGLLNLASETWEKCQSFSDHPRVNDLPELHQFFISSP